MSAVNTRSASSRFANASTKESAERASSIDDGASSTRIGALFSNWAASATRYDSPPLSLPIRRRRISVSRFTFEIVFLGSPPQIACNAEATVSSLLKRRRSVTVPIFSGLLQIPEITPEVGVSLCDIIFARVLFPLPFPPTTAIRSPRKIVKLMFLKPSPSGWLYEISSRHKSVSFT